MIPALYNAQICLRYPDDPCTVGAVAKRNLHTCILQKLLKLQVTVKLDHCRASVILVCPCKVCEHSLNLQIWKLCDFSDHFHIFRNIRKTNSGHSRIQCQMNMYCFSLTHCFPGKFLCFLILTDCRSYLILNKFRIIFIKDNPQDQDWFGNPCLAQMNCLLLQLQPQIPRYSHNHESDVRSALLRGHRRLP